MRFSELLPLNRYIDQSSVIDRANYLPFMLSTLSFGGNEYGIPAVEAALGLLLVYNKDLFRQAGLPDRGPDSLEELYEWHRALTRLDAAGERLQQVGINPLDSMGGFYFPLIWGTVFDVAWYDEANRRLNLLACRGMISSPAPGSAVGRAAWRRAAWRCK